MDASAKKHQFHRLSGETNNRYPTPDGL